jgi:hypothetical protein
MLQILVEAMPQSSRHSGIRPRSQLDRELPPKTDRRKRFDLICRDGCAPYALMAFLTVAGFDRATGGASIWDVAETPRSQFSKLPQELESLARKIESSSSILRLYWPAMYSDNPDLSESSRANARIPLKIYLEVLPALLRRFGAEARSAESWITERAGPKKYDTARHHTLILLRYVRTSTGKPHWANVACLLSHFSWKWDRDLRKNSEVVRAWKGRGRRDTTSLTIRPDALKQLWRRAEEYGFLPKELARRSSSKA